MDKKETRVFRINVVDILITIVLAAAITFGAFMISSAFGVDASAKTDFVVQYTLQFKGLESKYADKIAVGDTVVEAAKRFNIGTVSRVDVVPYVKDVFNDETGEMAPAVHPDLVTVNVTLTSGCYRSGDSYYISGMRISVGTGISIHAKNIACTGYVSAMSIK